MPFISIWKGVLYFLFGTFISRAGFSEEKEPEPGGFHNHLLKLYDILMVWRSPGPKDLIKKLQEDQAFKQPHGTPLSPTLSFSPCLLVPTSDLMCIILNHPADRAFTDRAEFTP